MRSSACVVISTGDIFRLLSKRADSAMVISDIWFSRGLILSGEFECREADHGPFINVPLLVIHHSAPRPGHGLEESIERRVTAPAQLIAVGPDEVEKSPVVTCTDAV